MKRKAWEFIKNGCTKLSNEGTDKYNVIYVAVVGLILVRCREKLSVSCRVRGIKIMIQVMPRKVDGWYGGVV